MTKKAKKAKKALQLSIEKWEKIVFDDGADEGPMNCELCENYFSAFNGNCSKCPVFHKTGLNNCRLTPYTKWSAHFSDKHYEYSDREIRCKTCLKLAKEELLFLISLKYEENNE